MTTLLSLTLALAPATLPPLPFPAADAAFGYFSLDDLPRLEMSLVRPLGTPRGEKRGGWLVILQRFTVVDARSPAGRTVDVRLPNRDPRKSPKLILGVKPTVIRFAAPPAAAYLLIGEKPASGHLSREFRPRRPDSIDDMPTLEATANERLGIALIETPLSRLPRNGSPVGDALRALAASSVRPREPLYAALPVWNWLLPISATTWAGMDHEGRAKRDVIEGLPILEFYRTRLVPLIPRATLQARDLHSAQYWALQAKWGVPGALSAVADRLERTVDGGQEMVFSFPYDVLDSLRPDDAVTEQDRVAWKRIGRASASAQSGYLRRLGSRTDGKLNEGSTPAKP